MSEFCSWLKKTRIMLTLRFYFRMPLCERSLHVCTGLCDVIYEGILGFKLFITVNWNPQILMSTQVYATVSDVCFFKLLQPLITGFYIKQIQMSKKIRSSSLEKTTLQVNTYKNISTPWAQCFERHVKVV